VASWVRRKARAAVARSRLLLAGIPQPGSAVYQSHVESEREHYNKVFAGEKDAPQKLIEPVPESWNQIQCRAGEYLRERSGNDIAGHLLARLRARPRARMLSLGSGPGGVELMLAREVPEANYHCIDLNPDLLSLGSKRAAEEQLPVEFEQGDLNTIRLPEREFDLILCHASLHHVIELEWIAGQMRRALREGGELIVVDIITRNGFRMWPETRRVVKALWKTLPEAYRVNHTAYPKKRVDADIWESDTRVSGMECIRSEDVLPVLARHFRADILVPYLSFSRRFFDTMYGPNYDLSRSLDQAILSWMWELDCSYVDQGLLRGESVFAVYRAD
jgi:ubiquinone/menaquinone biosynthesis C-methylase UbiE